MDDNIIIGASLGHAKKYGLTAAILLNKIIFLCNYTPRKDGFCWITRKQFEDETTLGARSFTRAWQKLVKEGVIEEKKDYIMGTKILVSHFKFIGDQKVEEKAVTKVEEPEVELVSEEEELVAEIGEILKMERRPIYTSGRKQKLKKRLKSFTKEEILQATRNLSTSPWHMGDNPNGTKYATVDFILRSDEMVEKWLNHDPRTAFEQKMRMNTI